MSTDSPTTASERVVPVTPDRAGLLAARLRIELAELHRTTASQRADHALDDPRPALFTDSGYTLEYEDA